MSDKENLKAPAMRMGKSTRTVRPPGSIPGLEELLCASPVICSWKFAAAAGAIMMLAVASAPAAQLEIQPEGEAPALFCGPGKTVRVVFNNTTDLETDVSMSFQIFQASFAVAVPVTDIKKWKLVQLFPRQTAIETLTVDLPEVKSQTSFVLRWLDEHNAVLGTTGVLVYPTNLLEPLKSLADGKPLGLFDPHNRLKPLLRYPGLQIDDLADSGIHNFTGRLAIIGPYGAEDSLPENLASLIGGIAKSGAAVVWVQPPPTVNSKLQPSFYSVNFGTNTVVVVQPGLIEGLAGNPRSQLNLVALATLARFPETACLPDNQ